MSIVHDHIPIVSVQTPIVLQNMLKKMVEVATKNSSTLRLLTICKLTDDCSRSRVLKISPVTSGKSMNI